MAAKLSDKQRTILLLAILHLTPSALIAEEVLQYEFKEIRIPAANADEPVREKFSLPLASKFLDQGALAWSGSRQCIACHTNGTYMVVRPSLSGILGEPPTQVREFFQAELQELFATKRDELRKSILPAQVIYAAAGLAEWDAHVTKSLSPETKQAISLMFELQLPSGTWGSADCWPPYESDAFHLATVAATAIAAAPGWLKEHVAGKELDAVERLKAYLRETTPPHDYGRILLLRTATRMSDLLKPDQKKQLVEMIRAHQLPDGGWSIRTFAKPEEWGRGNRAKKLRGEPEFENPPSDGHQTGLALVTLHEAGIPLKDPSVQKGIQWLLKNQRVSGRWWTRSLNTDGKHFIVYSGTAFPVLALSLYDAIQPPSGQK